MVTGSRVQECITPAQMNLIFNTRSFWREMAAWTRIYFRSRYLCIGNVEEVFRRLYELPDKFAAGLSLIFGDKFSTDYTLLLKQHVIILSELISAQFEGNIDEINRNVNLLYQNGYERAKYLGDFNPFWSAVEWRNLIDAYHYLTLEEANTFIVDDHKASIDVYERLTARAYSIVIFEGRGDPANISARFDAIFNEYRVTFSPFLGSQVIDENMQLIRAYVDLIIALIYARSMGMRMRSRALFS